VPVKAESALVVFSFWAGKIMPEYKVARQAR
jgi:hypothetical protein